MDLKAAFDTVNRKKLWQALERRGVRSSLIERIIELYEVAKVEIFTGEGNSEEFCSTEGLRQGCPLSPILFALYLADMEDKPKEAGIRGVKIGDIRVWSLAYADDVVLLAKGEEAIKEMMKIVRRYLEEKDLVLSSTKSKILVFEEGRGRRTERAELEKVQVKYIK